MKRMVVDGEQFDVSARAGEPGIYDFRWTSGPNEGYGFGSAGHGGGGMTDGELEDAIRDFLSHVDPTTGFIEQATGSAAERAPAWFDGAGDG